MNDSYVSCQDSHEEKCTQNSHLRSAERNWRRLHAKTFCDRTICETVMFTSLIREAEEHKENDGAEDRTPSAEFDRNNSQMIRAPQNSRNQFYGEPIEMHIGPTFPRLDGFRSGI